MCADEQDISTKVNADLEQVACETCVKDNTAMVAREVTSSTSGSKHQQRTSGQAGKEGEKKKMEGREGKEKGKVRGNGKEKEREKKEKVEEGVEKNVTGWTLVTRSAEQMRKMVQIFVKVDGMKTVAMEVSPEDKVQKILNTVSGSDWDVYVMCEGRILRKSEKLKSCGVRDGSTVQVMSRMRGGGKHKDKKSKDEKKQVAQLDDGMCAMACEQMRQVMETLRTLADKSTGEDKRCVVEKVEEVRKAIVGLRKQARGEDLQRVAELEESLKRLEEEMLPWSVEEQEQRRQEEQRRQGEQEQRRQEEREHAAMRNVATSARMAAKTTAVTSATAEAGDESTDETSRKGKGKGNGGKG